MDTVSLSNWILWTSLLAAFYPATHCKAVDTTIPPIIATTAVEPTEEASRYDKEVWWDAPNSALIGWIAMGILFFELFILLLLDLSNCARDFRFMRKNLRHRFGKKKRKKKTMVTKLPPVVCAEDSNPTKAGQQNQPVDSRPTKPSSTKGDTSTSAKPTATASTKGRPAPNRTHKTHPKHVGPKQSSSIDKSSPA